MIKKTNLLWPVSIAGMLLLGTFFSLRLVVTSAYAQPPTPDPNDIRVVKVLNQTSSLVRVGQDISFTIYITNNAGFTLTHANLFDDYEESILGNFGMVGGDPSPSTIDTTVGELLWTNLISEPATGSYFPPLAPGEATSLTIQFQVQHPPPTGGFAIVNRAQIRDAVFAGGGGGDGMVISTTAPITGGRAPIYKQLNPPSQMPNIGDLITYTIAFTNEGAAPITETTITDRFNPAYLLFITATPTAPTIIDPVNGLITWTNLATPPVQPGQAISVAVVFEILQTGLINNQAEMVRVLDYFGNNLSPGFDQVGITIVEDTPTPSRQDDQDNEQQTSTPTATPFPTQTPVVTATNTGPLYLPETGWHPVGRFLVPIAALILLTVGGVIAVCHNRP